METKICKKCNDDKPLSEFYHHRAMCKLCVISHNKEYRSNTKEARNIKSKEWYHSTKEKRKKHKSDYYRERRKTDNLFKLRSAISRLIRVSMKRNGFKKSSKTATTLGCTFEDFKNYIETKWEPWMNWQNYGLYNKEYNFGWDLDHIIPISKATSENEIIGLSHYSNYQPLCSKINRDIKRDR